MLREWHAEHHLYLLLRWHAWITLIRVRFGVVFFTVVSVLRLSFSLCLGLGSCGCENRICEEVLWKRSWVVHLSLLAHVLHLLLRELGVLLVLHKKIGRWLVGAVAKLHEVGLLIDIGTWQSDVWLHLTHVCSHFLLLK